MSNNSQSLVEKVCNYCLVFLIPALCSAESEKNVTTEEIIDILKEKGIITDQEYQDLKKKPIKRKSRKRKSIQ